MTDQPLTPAEQVRRLYEEAENRTSTALEDLVASEGFGEILAMVTGNAMALIKMSGEGLDQVVRSIRLAGRSDIARLGRQLARTEDKLEHVLQMVEQIESRMSSAEGEGGPTGPRSARAPSGTTRARSAEGAAPKRSR